MDPYLALTIAASRRQSFEATAATERLAAGLRAARGERATAALAARIADRVRAPRPGPAATPCPTC